MTGEHVILIIAVLLVVVFAGIAMIATHNRRAAERRQYAADRELLRRHGLAWGVTPIDGESNEDFRDRIVASVRDITRPITELKSWRRV